MRHHPRKGDAVWVEGREPQPNGYIQLVDYHTHEALIRFHNGGGSLSLEFDRFDSRERKGNMWMIYLDEMDEAFDTEHRMDVMILFDEEIAKDKPSVEYLLFLCNYFRYDDRRYADGCERRREAVAELLGKSSVDYAKVAAYRSTYLRGKAISDRINGRASSQDLFDSS